MKKLLKLSLMALAGFAVGLCIPHIAAAFTAPSSGSFAYDVYDITTNKIVRGAVGYAAAIAIGAWGVYNIARTEVGPGVAKLAGAGLLAVLTNVVNTMGITF